MGLKSRLKNNRIIRKYYIFYSGIRHINRGLRITQNEQSTESKILQISHRLERGLCLNYKDYKLNWGFNKANELISLLTIQKQISNNDSVRIGEAVLSAFVANKEQYNDERERTSIESLKNHARQSGISLKIDPEWGGCLKINKQSMMQDLKKCEELFKNRHSCRNFSSEPIDRKRLEYALELASYAPSSCNRQASEVYVLDAKDRERITGENIMGANKYLVICGKMDSFSSVELNDWIVSTSIFAGYLSMALHTVGIGSVFLRKEIINKDIYNVEVKKLCNIPDNQQIIIELAIGNYCDSFYVQVSKRKSVKEILHF